jgi:hypothetical protein
LNKPSKSDFVTITYKCYFPSNEIILDYYEDKPIKSYIDNLRLPKGIIHSIKNMRLGETSRITLQPKYGFRRVEPSIENFEKYIDTQYLKRDSDTFPNQVELLEKMKKTPIIYEVTLIDFLQIYDISGKKNLMKYVINKGDGVTKPSEGNEIIFNFKLFFNDECVYVKENQKFILDSHNFNEAERTIFKSLKKGEIAKIEILNSYFQEIIKQGYISEIFNGCYQNSLNLENKSRIIVEVELIKFKQNITYLNHKNKDYKIKTLNKGIGNVCPWKNSLNLLCITVHINGNLFYSDNKLNSPEELIQKLKDFKNNIKTIKNYDKNLQNIIEGYLQKGYLGDKIEYLVHDSLIQNFPCVFFSEIVPKMKLLETLNITFTDKMDYLNIGNQEIINDTELKEYSITITLLNFLERPSLFNKIYSEETQLKKLMEYKSRANFFFSKSILNKSKKINKYLVDEYLKYSNLERGVNKLTQNQSDFNQINLLQNDPLSVVQQNIHTEMKKINSNLILIYFKMKKYKKCDEYIQIFFILFDKEQKDEKILYFKYKILKEGFKFFDQAKLFIEKLIECHPESRNLPEYTLELNEMNKKISENLKQKNNFVKKMFKFEN